MPEQDRSIAIERELWSRRERPPPATQFARPEIAGTDIEAENDVGRAISVIDEG
jgi:hypothetical protein